MKKLLFLLAFIFISSSSFSQIIVNKRTEVVEKGKKLVMVKSTGEIRTNDKIIIHRDIFNITEIQDEFIEIRLGKRYHLLSTSKHKNIKISSHRKKKYWNVYDGGVLIPMQDEIDVLNFFNKYGFEYFKQNATSSSNRSSYVPPTTSTSFTSNLGGSSITTTTTRATPIFSSSSKSRTSITFKNNNN